MGLNPIGFNVSSFSPKSLSLKQAPKGKKVLSRGRAASNTSKIVIEPNHHTSASFTPITHSAFLSAMGAEMDSHHGGSCRGSFANGEGSSKADLVAAREVVQFGAQRSPKRRPIMIRRDCEVGFVDAL